MADVCAGNGQHQVDEHAAVQGQRIDGALVDDVADTGILGLEQFACGFDGDGLAVACEAQFKVSVACWPTSRLMSLGLLEAGGIDGELIGAGLQAGDLIEA